MPFALPADERADAVPAEDWPPQRIKDLRSAMGLSQGPFGMRVFDYDESAAQAHVSKLESGKIRPSAAARKTLERLEREVQAQETGHQ